MTAFEFAFSLFGLVLGLAMAQVLLGFVKVLKARSSAPGERTAIRIGFLTPAIGTLVTLDLVSAWLLAWYSRSAIPIDFLSLIFGTAVTALYFVAASLVWPDDPADWPDLDDWFDRHKGQIGGAIALANAGFTLVDLLNGGDNPAVIQIAYVALAFALIVTRRRWQSVVVLSLMFTVFVMVAAGGVF